MKIESDVHLESGLDVLRRSGETKPLAALTSFGWDSVYFYYDGATADKVNGEVEATVLRPGTRLTITGVLAVFVEPGKAVKPVGIQRELVFEPGRQPDGVMVEKGVTLRAPA